MAENNSFSFQDNQTTQLQGSLIQDSAPNNQPAGSHRFALNVVPETSSGDRGFISNEAGNTQCLNLGAYSIIGSIPLSSDEIVLFMSTTDQSNSKIAIQKNCTLTTIVETPCLLFNDLYPITGITKTARGCNRIIYFRDSYNSDRSIDIDEILNNPLDNQYYDGTWHCELFKMNPDFTFPCIDYIQTNNSGGNLKLGMYQFGVALGDENLNFTGVLSVTQPIPIVQGIINGDVSQIEGGDPLIERTNKSIQLQISSLDQDYSYIKLYVIETIAGVTTAYEAITLAIFNGSITYTYGGVDASAAIVTQLSLINAPIVIYEKSKTMEQQDQRLIKGNLQERLIDHSAWQRAANDITASYVTVPIKYTGNSSVFSGDYYVDNRTYMRDEVYALSIRGVFTDGSNTSEYHIPGRTNDSLGTGFGVDPNVTALKHNRKLPIGFGWDTSAYTIVSGYTLPQPNGLYWDWDTVSDSNIPNTGPYFTPSSTEICIEEVKHLNKVVGEIVQRWEVFNTALQETQNTVYDSTYTEGQLAFWQSSFEYPDTEDCAGNRIYPEGNIRHHKMPDSTLEPHFVNIDGSTDASGDYIISLGLKFNLAQFKITLENLLGTDVYNEIQGFVISRAKRDKGNKSVFDKGLACRAMEMIYEGSDYAFQLDLFNKHGRVDRLFSEIDVKDFDVLYDNTSYLPDENVWDGDSSTATEGTLRHSYTKMYIHNPKNQFYADNQVGYIKNERELFGKIEYWGDASGGCNGDGEGGWGCDKNRASFRCVYNNYHTTPNYNGTPMPLFTNRLIGSNRTNVLPAQNTLLGTVGVINSLQQEALLTEIDNYPDLSNDGLSYGGGPENMFGGSAREIDYSFSDVGIAEQYSKVYYVGLKQYSPAQYGQLHTLTYYPINTCLISKATDEPELFGGDCFISQISFRKTYTDQNFLNLDERTWFQNLISYFVESEINTKLRHENTTDTNQFQQWYYPFHGTSTTSIQDVIWENDEEFLGTTSITDIISEYVAGNYCKNKYNYNQDYSLEQQLRPNFPLNLGFDYCSECGNDFPFRVIYSDKSYQEDLSDAYRRFPVNNYRDISASSGPIFNLFRQSDQLYIRTKQSLWFVPTKQQTLQTDVGDIQIGTGELFSLPPKELQSVTIGYNGGQTSLDLVINEYGAIYADAESGSVFLLKNGEQKEISNIGNRIWFKENLPFNISSFSSSFTYTDSITSTLGVGLVGYYDAVTRRYILTKRDYYPVYPDDTAFNANSKVWVIDRAAGTVSTDNPYHFPQYFENKSWTISYDLENDKWLSWHSYLPNYGYNTRDNYYTSVKAFSGSSYSWAHNGGLFTNYYGTQYPFVVEYINTKSPTQTKISNTVSYICDIQTYDTTRKYYMDVNDETFTQGLFYNTTQSTGLLDINVKNNNDPFASVLGSFDPSQVYSERTESNWNISNIRDMVDQTSPKQSIFTTNWTDIQSQYFIDKLPNSNIINYLTKSQFEMEEMRDNYLACRFYYKPTENRRLTVKFINNNNNFSFR